MAEPLLEGEAPAATAAAPARGTSYGQILRSSALIGGASLLNVGAGIVRSKITAVLLGPAGFGLMGLFMSILNLAQSVAAVGVNSSGVRQIAAAVGTGDEARIARTAAVLRWASLGLGLAGGLILAALAVPVARLTFGDGERAAAVAILGVAVLLRVVADGYGALLQGLRRIADIARINVLGAATGAVATIALVYLFGETGVAPSLVVSTGLAAALSFWYARKVRFARARVTRAVFAEESSALVRLGFAFMASGMLMMGAAYAVRLVVVRELGLEAAGFYQAAWAIGGMYVGFVLDSMASDFYPRLTAAIDDHEACNRLVNEQAQISLLLAGPGVLATVVFAPLVVSMLYSQAFGEAVELLRWLCLGAALRVITWPMGFIIVARAQQRIFLAVEIAYVAVYLALAWLLVGTFGLDGSGIAFLGSYLFHGVMLYPVVRRMTGFTWSAANRRLIVQFLALSAAVFAGFRVLPTWPAFAVGTVAVVASGLHSLRTLVRLFSPDRLPRPVRRVFGWMHLA